MQSANGKLFSTGGDESWPVTYRIHSDEHGVSGTIEFAADTRLQSGNRQLPMYLELADGRWALVFLPGDGPSPRAYAIGGGSAVIDAPSWVR
jgi:hypothetical protein